MENGAPDCHVSVLPKIQPPSSYDLPFGRGQRFASHAWRPLDYAIGGWTVAALPRIASGFPYMVYLSDTNQLGDLTHSARPNMLSGVPLVNPLFSINCPTGAGCQPYLNRSEEH